MCVCGEGCEICVLWRHLLVVSGPWPPGYWEWGTGQFMDYLNTCAWSTTSPSHCKCHAHVACSQSRMPRLFTPVWWFSSCLLSFCLRLVYVPCIAPVNKMSFFLKKKNPDSFLLWPFMKRSTDTKAFITLLTKSCWQECNVSSRLTIWQAAVWSVGFW